MFRSSLMAVVLLSAVMATGQTNPSGSQGAARPYQPSVPSASMVNSYGGYGGYGYGGASTVAGSAMQGMASVISAKGDYNLSTSAAAVNMTQAEKQDIQNRMSATQTYFDMRAVNRAARAAEDGPRLTTEQIVRIAREGAPKPLGPGQVDPVSGKVNWPDLLQDDSYSADRAELDALLAKRASYGGLGYSDQTKVRATIDNMAGQLKAQIRDVPTQLYIDSKTFLASLSYAVTKTQLN